VTERGPIGFVGLGAMGTPIVEALADAGHELVVYDVDPAAVERATTYGALRAASPAAVADAAETVFVSLPKPEVVREVATGASGLVEGGAIRAYVDLSTTGAVVAGEVAAALSEREIEVLDAPVSGGVAGALARTLAVMAAGDAVLFERVRPLFESFAKNVFLVGPTPGQGQTVKLLNNLLSASALAITSEAITFGATAGLDPVVLLDVFNAGSGRNTATAAKFPEHVLTRRFESGFKLELMAKDVELCVAEARGRRFPMILSGLVQQLWTLAASQAEPGADHTEIVRLFERWAGVEIGTRESVGR
jgi:3-hydroxyisobutyrate dehydrogenase-like beta-hydroxyacid dehydrogenase